MLVKHDRRIVATVLVAVIVVLVLVLTFNTSIGSQLPSSGSQDEKVYAEGNFDVVTVKPDGGIANEATTAPPSTTFAALDSCAPGQFAFTFDDGPDISYTENILSGLADTGIKATFFFSPAKDGSSPGKEKCDLIAKAARLGHAIENHSWSHPSFLGLTNEQIEMELKMCSDFIVQCGAPKPTFFRPPWGHLRKAQASYINSLGYVVAFWNIDSLDWKTPEIYRSIQKAVDLQFSNYKAKGNGDLPASVIMLQHDRPSDVSNATGKSVARYIFDSYAAKYSLVTIPECYKSCGSAVCQDPINPHKVLASYNAN